jgi:hypothetical protein
MATIEKTNYKVNYDETNLNAELVDTNDLSKKEDE